jgi:putative sterol carrier protein
MVPYSLDEITLSMERALPTSKFPAKRVIMIVDGAAVLIDGQAKTVQPCGEDEECDLKVSVTLEVLRKLLQKKLTPQQAFVKGLLKVTGNMGLAMKLTILVNDTRKEMQPASKL